MMRIPNNHPFTQAGVLARMTEMAGTRYRCSKLAQSFKVKSHEMRMMLNKMVERDLIRYTVDGKNHTYWVPTEAELAVVEQERYFPPFRPLNGYEQSMRRFAEMAEKGR